jgi:serine/threonine protein phosphatase PrpC
MSSVHFFALSERGLRDNNENSFCAERIGEYPVLAVADGLGGHAVDEIASGIAIECMKNAVKFSEGNIKTMLRNATFDTLQILYQIQTDTVTCCPGWVVRP